VANIAPKPMKAPARIASTNKLSASSRVFLCANALGLAGDFNREQRIKAVHGFSS
jgi:hypothetical protein